MNSINPLWMYQFIRMQGQHVDEESGLHYNRHRYYDPTLGRYISQDPIGVRGGWNLYAYPLNPVKTLDPLGLASWDILIKQAGTKFATSDTTSRPTPSMRPDGQPWGAGCGDAGTDKYVPDGLMGADFMDVCRTHDNCYGKLGGNKSACDSQLSQSIALACNARFGDIPDGGRTVAICHSFAGDYWLAVDQLGDGAFENAQKIAESQK